MSLMRGRFKGDILYVYIYMLTICNYSCLSAIKVLAVCLLSYVTAIVFHYLVPLLKLK